MNKEVLISMVNSGKIRFIPLRRCSLCNEYIGYKFLCFLPGDKIEDLTMDETDGFVDTTGIVTSIKSKDVVEFYVENPFVKIKDE